MLSLVTGAMLAAPAAHAFTLENDPTKTPPKFDLDEQLRLSRTPQLDTSIAGKKGMETPFGTLQFGVQRNVSPFSTPYGPSFGGSAFGNSDRRHYERMFAPPHKQHQYD